MDYKPPMFSKSQVNTALILLACFLSAGLGYFMHSSAVDQMNEHAEELARIEAGDTRQDIMWTVIGLGIGAVLLACAVAIVLKAFGALPDDGDDDENDTPPTPPSPPGYTGGHFEIMKSGAYEVPSERRRERKSFTLTPPELE